VEALLALLMWNFAVFALTALAINVAFGYAGVPHFGLHLNVLTAAAVIGGVLQRALWMAWLGGSGDYVDASANIAQTLSATFAANPALGVAIFAASLVVGAAVGALFGWLVSLPVARLREEYLAMTTLAVAEIAYTVLRIYEPVVGGPYGISLFNPLSAVANISVLAYPLLMVLIAASVTKLVAGLLESPLGRVFRAIRDDDVAAASLGYDVVRARQLAMAISGALGGLAGTLYVFYVSAINAVSLNRFTWTFIPWLITILGGLGNWRGSLIGAAAFSAIYVASVYAPRLVKGLPFDVVWLQYILFGVMILLILVYRPSGVLPERPTKTLERNEVEEIRSRSEPKLN